MSRRSRRAAVIRSGVPEVIGRPFDDATDSLDSQESLSLPGVDQWPDSPVYPSVPAAPVRLPTRSVGAGVWGGTPQAKQGHILNVNRALAWERKRRANLLHAKRVSLDLQRWRADRERRRAVFNVLASPFSKRARHCVKRKVRKEVLFALRSLGRINKRSPGSGGTYRRKVESHWRC